MLLSSALSSLRNRSWITPLHPEDIWNVQPNIVPKSVNNFFSKHGFFLSNCNRHSDFHIPASNCDEKFYDELFEKAEKNFQGADVQHAIQELESIEILDSRSASKLCLRFLSALKDHSEELSSAIAFDNSNAAHHIAGECVVSPTFEFLEDLCREPINGSAGESLCLIAPPVHDSFSTLLPRLFAALLNSQKCVVLMGGNSLTRSIIITIWEKLVKPNPNLLRFLPLAKSHYYGFYLQGVVQSYPQFDLAYLGTGVTNKSVSTDMDACASTGYAMALIVDAESTNIQLAAREIFDSILFEHTKSIYSPKICISLESVAPAVEEAFIKVAEQISDNNVAGKGPVRDESLTTSILHRGGNVSHFGTAIGIILVRNLSNEDVKSLLTEFGAEKMCNMLFLTKVRSVKEAAGVFNGLGIGQQISASVWTKQFSVAHDFFGKLNSSKFTNLAINKLAKRAFPNERRLLATYSHFALSETKHCNVKDDEGFRVAAVPEIAKAVDGEKKLAKGLPTILSDIYSNLDDDNIRAEILQWCRLQPQVIAKKSANELMLISPATPPLQLACIVVQSSTLKFASSIIPPLLSAGVWPIILHLQETEANTVQELILQKTKLCSVINAFGEKCTPAISEICKEKTLSTVWAIFDGIDKQFSQVARCARKSGKATVLVSTGMIRQAGFREFVYDRSLGMEVQRVSSDIGCVFAN